MGPEISKRFWNVPFRRLINSKMNSLYQIEKLDEKNYESWNIQIRIILVHSGLWSVTSGKLKQESVPDGVDWHGLDQRALEL